MWKTRGILVYKEILISYSWKAKKVEDQTQYLMNAESQLLKKLVSALAGLFTKAKVLMGKEWNPENWDENIWVDLVKNVESLKRDTHPNVHSSIITVSKMWKKSKFPPTDEKINKMWDISIFLHTMEYYSVIKKNETFAIWSNIVGLGGHYAKWNNSDRERWMYKSLIYET